LPTGAGSYQLCSNWKKQGKHIGRKATGCPGTRYHDHAPIIQNRGEACHAFSCPVFLFIAFAVIAFVHITGKPAQTADEMPNALAGKHAPHTVLPALASWRHGCRSLLIQIVSKPCDTGQFLGIMVPTLPGRVSFSHDFCQQPVI